MYDVFYIYANLVLGLYFLELGPIYATDKRQTKVSLNAPAY